MLTSKLGETRRPARTTMPPEPESKCWPIFASGQQRMSGSPWRAGSMPLRRGSRMPPISSRALWASPGRRANGWPGSPGRTWKQSRNSALLQICEAGPDWIDGPSRKADGGAGTMAQGKEFKGRQFTAEVILWAVRWYLMFPISYRDLELMLQDRGVTVDHTTLFRWIQAYAPELEKRIRPHLRACNGSWRVD